MQALSEAERVSPGALQGDPRVQFELRLQQFLETLRRNPGREAQMRAMVLARTSLSPAAKACTREHPLGPQEGVLAVRPAATVSCAISGGLGICARCSRPLPHV
jgi:hypothetical protein